MSVAVVELQPQVPRSRLIRRAPWVYFLSGRLRRSLNCGLLVTRSLGQRMGDLVITMAPVSGHVISGRGGPVAASVLSIRVHANLIGAPGMAETVPILRQWLLLKLLS